MSIKFLNNEKVGMLNIDQFSTWELDTICSSEYHPPKDVSPKKLPSYDIVHAERLRIGKHLIKEYTDGSDKTTPDAWRVHDLREKILKQTDPEENKEPYPYPFSSDFFNRIHTWFFTGIRLLTVRIHRFFVYFQRPFLPKFFPYLGLSNGLSFLVDLCIVLKNTFFGKRTADDIKLKRNIFQRAFMRFKNSMTESMRPSRMINDFAWFVINLTVLLVTGPLYLLLNPLLNAFGFFFDTIHETGWLAVYYKRHTQLLNKLDKVTDELKKQKLLTPDNKEIDQQIQAVGLMHGHVNFKRFDAMSHQGWVVGCCTGIMLGMALLLYPPAAIPYAFLIGSAIALIAGSVMYGIGRRSYLISTNEGFRKKIKNFCEAPIDTLLEVFHLKTRKKATATSASKKAFCTSQILGNFKTMDNPNTNTTAIVEEEAIPTPPSSPEIREASTLIPQSDDNPYPERTKSIRNAA